MVTIALVLRSANCAASALQAVSADVGRPAFARLTARFSARTVTTVSVPLRANRQMVGEFVKRPEPAGSDRLDRDDLCECGEGFDVLFVAGEDGAPGLGQGDDDGVDG